MNPIVEGQMNPIVEGPVNPIVEVVVLAVELGHHSEHKRHSLQESVLHTLCKKTKWSSPIYYYS